MPDDVQNPRSQPSPPKPLRRPVADPERDGAKLPVLFLSGAGLPTWIWDEVRDRLPAGSSSEVACYPRPSAGPAAASLADYADAVATNAPWERFAVVAHSSGGAVAASLLGRHAGRVSAVLGVAAVVPTAGRSFLGSMPMPARVLLPAVMRLAGTRPPAATVRAMAAQLSQATADRLVADYDAESRRLFVDRAPARPLVSVRAYVRCTQDPEVPQVVQRSSASALGVTEEHQMACGHLPMLQDPAALSGYVRLLVAEASRLRLS